VGAIKTGEFGLLAKRLSVVWITASEFEYLSLTPINLITWSISGTGIGLPGLALSTAQHRSAMFP
jgi:hypothetical protein